jgi:hypothetical protein
MRNIVGDVCLMLFDPKDIPADLRDCFEEVETACGAAWERVTEKEFIYQQDCTSEANTIRGRNGEKGSATGWEGFPRGSTAVQTTGWRPTCTCEAGEPVPATILDLFGGAGTVGLVADRLGRDARLIELNPDYCQMAYDRLVEDSPLFAAVTLECPEHVEV